MRRYLPAVVAFSLGIPWPIQVRALLAVGLALYLALAVEGNKKGPPGYGGP